MRRAVCRRRLPPHGSWLVVFFAAQKILSFVGSILSVLTFLAFWWHIQRNHCPDRYGDVFFLYLLSVEASSLTCQGLLRSASPCHVMTQGSRLAALHEAAPFPQHHLLQGRTVLSLLCVVGTGVTGHATRGRADFGAPPPPPSSHGSVMCQRRTVSLLWLATCSGVRHPSPPAWFFCSSSGCSKIVLAAQSPLKFYLNFKMAFSICANAAVGVSTGTVLRRWLWGVWTFQQCCVFLL